MHRSTRRHLILQQARIGLLSSLLVVILALSLAQPTLAQDDISFSASVDRATLSTDQTLTLQLTLSGAFRNSGKPQLPPLEGFAVVGSSQSSQFSIVNGKMSSQMTFTYRLQPTKTGELTIPSISIQVENETYQSEALTVNITQGEAPQPQSPSGEAPEDLAPPNELAGQDLYVEAEVDNPTPVVGQQIIYTFRLYQAVNFFNQPSLNWPDFTNFLSYDMTPNTQYNQTVANRHYLVTEVRRALFPTAQGQVTLDPAVLQVPGSLLNQGIEMQTQSVTVDIQPLPEDAPASFNGAVGSFDIEAWVDPTEGRVNEPVTLFVRIKGTGNISTVPDPTEVDATTLPGWRVYDPQVKTDIGQQGTLIQGEKLFERLMVPKTEGGLVIPAFTLAFFDPESGVYREVTTEPLEVSIEAGDAQAPPVVVTNGKQDVVVLGTDIRHIKPAAPTLAIADAPLLRRPLYWAGWALPILVVLGTWAWDQRRRVLQRDVAYARTLRARKLARRRLSQASKQLHQDEDVVYAEVARALLHYLGDKFNLPPAGLTRDVIRQMLKDRGVVEARIQRVLACLDWADSGRFAPIAGGRSAEDLIHEAESVITQLEEVLA